MSDEPRSSSETAPSEADRRDYRFRIAGDVTEAFKVVLAQLPDDD